MHAWVKLGAVLGSVLLTITAAAAELKGEVLEYGVYSVAQEQQRIRDLSTPTGYVRTGGKTVLANQTTQIHLQQGRLFGFRFRVSGFDSGQADVYLRLYVEHPPMTRPNGSIATNYSSTIPLIAVKGAVQDYAGYSLDNAYEMVAGTWVFSLWLDDQRLVEQSFTTVAE